MKKINGAEGQLKEVKTAGYKFSKRETNTNKKAGLHDKKKNLAEGESRVKRRKPLELKHVRRMRKAAVALSCVFVVAAGVVGAGAFVGDGGTSYTGYKTVCYEVPEPALDPTQYTLVQNVGFMNYVLQNQPFWSSSMSSDVNAMGFDQHVETYKQYYNGILISCDIADGFSHKATQYCVNTEKEVVLWRQAKGKFDGMNSEWSTDKASKTDFEKFIEWRGFPPSEFSVYVLNEKTIKNAEEYSVVRNSEGNFEMTLELNVGLSSDEAEFAADCYYVKQMKATGDLPSLPSIKKTSVTYVFDESWRVLSFEINDEYTAMGAIPCSSKTNVIFDYAEENAKNTFYEDYFKEYEDSASSEITDEAPSAATYLGSAFGSVLTEGGIFKIDLNIDKLAMNGVAYVGMKDKKLTDMRVKLGDIAVFADADGMLYVTDGYAKYKLNIGGLLSSAEEASAQPKGAGLDTDALMEQIMNGTFTVGENSTLLECALEIFGLNADLSFNFIPGDGKVELDYCKAEIPLGDKLVKATLRFGNESDMPAKPADTSGYTDILSDGLTVDLTAKLDGLTLNGFAHIAMKGGAFKGVYAELGSFKVFYAHPDNMLGLSDGKSKIKLNPSSLANAAVLNDGGNGISAILKQIIENFSAEDGKINVRAETELFGQTVFAALGVQLSGGIKIDADLNAFGKDIGVSLALANREVVLPDLAEYTDVLNDGITLDATLVLDKAELNGKITVGLDGGKFTYLSAQFGDIKIDFEARTKVLYIAVGSTKAFVNMEQIPYGTADMAGLFGGETSKTICELLANLSAGLREISTSANVNIFDSIIPANLAIILPSEGEGLKVKADVTLFGIVIDATVGLDSEKVPALSEEDKEVYIDALKKPFEVADKAVGGLISANVAGTLYDYGGDYLSTSRIKYTFEASLEYDAGRDYVPEDGETACNPLYLHANIALTAHSAKDDSLYLDLLVMDANPASTNDNGKTNGGYYTDGVMDVYLSVSNKKNGTPLKIYADIDEILTLVSMLGSAADLGNIRFEDSETLTQAVAKLGEIIDGQLIEKYLPYTKDQFASLGASLIPQILGKPLGEFLGEIISKLNTKPADVNGGSELDLNKAYIDSITYGDNSLKLVLNSSEVYNTEMAEEDFLSVTISKDVLEDGANRLSGIDLRNIYFGKDNVNELDINLALGYDAIAKPDKTSGLSGYLNTDGIDTLLKALVNSATHEAGTNDDGRTAYELNHTYLLSGQINADMLGVVKVDLDVKTLKVVIKENNTVYADAHIGFYYELTKLSKTSGELYLSIMNDMAFVKRVMNGAEETRIMPVNVFLDDMVNQIGWMFKFPDWIMNIIKGQVENGGSGEGIQFAGKDYGEILDYVLPRYKFVESGNDASWTVKIGGGMLKDLTGMKFDDIPVTFNAVKNDGGMYTVTGLSIPKLAIDVGIKINVSASFTYDNPHEVLLNGKEDTSKDLINGALPEIDGNSWNKVLGGESFEEISSKTDWELVKKETGLNYIDFRSGSPLAVATLAFEYATDTDNSAYTEFGERQLVLYNKSTGTVYTKATVPELPADKNVAGCKLDWNEGLIQTDGLIVRRAEYKNTYKVTVESKFDIGEIYVYDEAENVYRRTEEEAYKRILLKKDVIYRKDNATYSLLGYTYKGSDAIISFNETAVDNDGDICFVAEVNAPADYVAVWECAYEVTFVVTDVNGATVSRIPVHYYEGEMLSSRLPAIPGIKGYTGAWDYSEDYAISADMSAELATVCTKYTINSYTVTVVSAQEVEGFTADGNGNYVSTATYLYNTEIALEAVASKHNGYKFVRYYGENKESVESAVVESDVTYYIEWAGKTVNVTFKSDLQFDGSKPDGGYYTTSATLRYGNAGDTLLGFDATENLLLGWFIETAEEDGSVSYSYIKDAEALKSSLEPQLAGRDEISVTLGAVWVSRLTVNITKASTTDDWLKRWEIRGNYSGGDYASGYSRQIAESANISSSVAVRYEQSQTGGHLENENDSNLDGLQSGKWFNVSGNVFGAEKMTHTKTYAYGGARIRVIFSIGGNEVFKTSYSEHIAK